MAIPGEVAVILGSTLLFGSILWASSNLMKSVGKGSYVLSTFHAISILLLTSYTIIYECSSSNHSHCLFNSSNNSILQQFTLMYSIGYFLVDLVVVLWLVPDFSAALHHSSIIIGQIAAVFSGASLSVSGDNLFQYDGSAGYPLACFLFAAELSAPFLNIFLSGMTTEGSQADFLARAGFALTFILARLIVCPFMTYEFVLNSPDAPLVPKLVCLFIMGISLHWSRTVVGNVIKAIRGPSMPYCKGDAIEFESRARVKGE